MTICLRPGLTALMCAAAVLASGSVTHGQFGQAQFATGTMGGGWREPPPPPEVIEKLLLRRNRSARRRAARLLLESDDKAKPIVPTIRKALSDPDPLVHVPAACWLATHEPENPAIVPLLMKSLAEDLNDYCQLAVRAIKKLEPERTGEAVRAMMSHVPPRPSPDEDPRVLGTNIVSDPFWKTRDALSFLGPDAREALPLVLTRFETGPGVFNGWLVSLLGEIRGAGAVGALTRALETAKDLDVRWESGQTLVRIAPPTREIGQLMLDCIKADTKGVVSVHTRWGGKFLVRVVPDAVDQLRAMLESDAPPVRRNAATLLGSLEADGHPAIPDILRACNDTDVWVRRAAFEALETMKAPPDKEVVTAYAKAMEDTDPRIVMAALGAARQARSDPTVHQAMVRLLVTGSSDWGIQGCLGGALGLSGLLELLDHEDPVVRERSLQTIPGQLGELSVESAAEVSRCVLPFLADRSVTTREAATAVLGRITGSTKSIPAANGSARPQALDMRFVADQLMPKIDELLDDQEPGVRVRAAYTLATIREESGAAATRLVELLSDPDPKIQAGAREALGEIRPPAGPHVDRLLAMLDSPAAATRANAAWVLGSLEASGSKVVSGLTRATKDPDPNTRQAAARSLPLVGAALDVSGPLVKALSDEEREVRSMATCSLAALDPRVDAEITPALVRNLKDVPEIGAGSALISLGKKTPAVENALIDLYASDTARARELEQAAWVLEHVGTEACVARLIRRLVTPGKGAPERAEAAIITIGPDLDVVLNALVESDVDPVSWDHDRRILVKLFRSIGPEVVDELVAWSASPNVKKRRVAVLGLRIYRDVGKAGTEALTKFVEDTDPKCRQASINGLREVFGWENDYPPAVRDALLRVWFKQDCAESLEERCYESNEFTCVVDALKECGDGAAERLISAMETGDRRTRRLAAEGLFHVEIPEYLVPRLQRMAQSPDKELRELTRELFDHLVMEVAPVTP